MEPEKLIQCPYDKNHQIRPSRLPYHLVKCRENNPQIAKMLATCPYNARHRVLKQELKVHLQTCDDRCEPELFEEVSIKPKEEPSNPLSFWDKPPCEENWDVDDEPVSPFILDVSGNSFLKQRTESSSNPVGDPRSSSTSAAWLPTSNTWKQDEMPPATSGLSLADELGYNLRFPGTAACPPAESLAYRMDEAVGASNKGDLRSSQTLRPPRSSPWKKEDTLSPGASGHTVLSNKRVADNSDQKGGFQGSQISAASVPRYITWKKEETSQAKMVASTITQGTNVTGSCHNEPGAAKNQKAQAERSPSSAAWTAKSNPWGKGTM
ncbi:uncharacterized protein LOC115087675 isoform X2 [Rhinatrema bivittatum]|uniref:uncharacterized protein LOC115087675 isoform X2 n=1 Tax=Rhinatrema bivittatum TaxID=194408 RepID=UPI00112A615B|nr:uncharacterized protein LOC115087675 isoform X2 [Rhinatrema bivittatum]